MYEEKRNQQLSNENNERSCYAENSVEDLSAIFMDKYQFLFFITYIL